MVFRLVRVLFVVAVGLLAWASPAPAEAAAVRELTAFATFRSDTSAVDPGNPCLYTLTEITIEELNQGSETVAQAYLEVREFDECVTDDLGLVAWYFTIEPLDASEYEIHPGLRSASIDTTIEVCNLVDSSDCLDVTLDLTWTANGRPESDQGTIRRDASVSGTLEENSRDLAPDGALSAGLVKEVWQ